MRFYLNLKQTITRSTNAVFVEITKKRLIEEGYIDASCGTEWKEHASNYIHESLDDLCCEGELKTHDDLERVVCFQMYDSNSWNDEYSDTEIDEVEYD